MTRLAARAVVGAPGQLAALAPAKLSEKELQRAVMKLAKDLGYELRFHAYQPFQAGERGWPDLFLLRTRDRRIVFAELKSATGKLSDRQAEVIEMLRALAARPTGVPGHLLALLEAAGGPRVDVFVWRPEDWQSGEIERALR